MSFSINVQWRDVKSFLDRTQLFYNLSYVEFELDYLVWVTYEDAVLYARIQKNNIDVEDFLTYAAKTIIKKTILEDGTKHVGVQGILDRKYARKYCFQGGISRINPSSNYFISTLYNNNHEQVSDLSEATITCIRFMPPFNYDIMGGELFIENYNVDDNVHVSVVGNPDIPAEYGGSVQCISNEKCIDGKITLESKESMPLRYFEGLNTNVIMVHIMHSPGYSKNFQLKILFYAKSVPAEMTS